MKKNTLHGNYGECVKIAKINEKFALLTDAQFRTNHGIQARLGLFGHTGEQEGHTVTGVLIP